MLTIYFNRTYATTAHVLVSLRSNPDGRPVRIIGTHADQDSPVLAVCDLALPEPDSGVIGLDYVEWALDFTRRHSVDVFVPRFELHALSSARERFAAQGIALVAAPPAAIAHFDDKAATYDDAASLGVRIPPHRIVTTAAELLESFAAIREEFGTACLKPVTGVGGDGFRILVDERFSLANLLGPLSPEVDVTSAAHALSTADPTTLISPLMVMPFLPGPEVSIDVLASPQGEPLTAIGRSKDGRRRMIVNDLAAREMAETLVSAHRVSYLSNTQVRYWRGPSDERPVPYLLEVNTRLSGGLFQTSLSGANLAWSAIRMAIGEDAAIGPLDYGVAYATVSAIAPLAKSSTGPGDPALRANTAATWHDA